MNEHAPRSDIDDDALTHLERLARLVIEPEERASLRRDLVALLGFVDTLLEVDVSGVDEYGRGVEPAVLDPGAGAMTETERHDSVTPSLPPAAALALAPEQEGGFFKVPRTVDEG